MNPIKNNQPLLTVTIGVGIYLNQLKNEYDLSEMDKQSLKEVRGIIIRQVLFDLKDRSFVYLSLDRRKDAITDKVLSSLGNPEPLSEVAVDVWGLKIGTDTVHSVVEEFETIRYAAKSVSLSKLVTGEETEGEIKKIEENNFIREESEKLENSLQEVDFLKAFRNADTVKYKYPYDEDNSSMIGRIIEWSRGSTTVQIINVGTLTNTLTDTTVIVKTKQLEPVIVRGF